MAESSPTLTQEQLAQLARLSRLNLSPDSAAPLTEDVNAILRYVEQLSEVDTEDVEPTNHVHGAHNVFREDKQLSSSQADSILEQAPERSGRFIKVPLVVDQEGSDS